MPTDDQIIQAVQAAFANCPRPEHFTDHTHCLECAEHDALLRSRDIHTLSFEDVGDACWSPLCFLTSEGFVYYLPALIRLSLPVPPYPEDWLGDQLFSLLRSDGRQNARVLACSADQRNVVAGFLRHLIETKAAAIDEHGHTDIFFQALEIWSEEIHFNEIVPPGI
jgi:hypothetical protein